MTRVFTDPLVVAWSRAFAVTLLVELAVATPLLGPAEPSRWRRAALVAVANVASHPAVWFIFPALALGATTRLALSELWAVLLELGVYRLALRDLPALRAVAASALANGASLGLGLLLRSATGWV
ncbi:hypothetical protein WME89_06930 [Sorangium sp. So ce321]|uniref:hypothetical protein n=1 Tax=Sorangium sp. So ce321 TaxID=3133300 RepID=UPI003F647D76